MLLSARLSFAAKHLFAHVFFYLIPRLLSGILSRWPRRILSWWRLLPAPKDEREVTLIANSGDVHHLRQRFALPAPNQPPMRYSSPLYNGHIETVLAGLRSGPAVRFERELVEADGGQHVNMDFLYPPASPDMSAAAPAAKGKAPHAKGIFFVVPGLLNASTTNYSRHFADVAVRSGFAVCVLNYRGMGTTPLEVPRLFSATFTADICYCLHHYLRPEQVQSRLGTPEPVPLIAVGFSLGGVTLMKYLGEQGVAAAERERKESLPEGSVPPDTPVSALFTVTSPYDLIEADKMCDTAAYRHLYEKPFAVGLRKYSHHNRAMLAQLPNVDARWLFEGPSPGINRISSIREFDVFINAGHNGFASTREYYAAAQPFTWLARCRTPVLCIGDRNDVVAGLFVPDAQWRALVEQNPYVVYVCFPVGGHLGFVGGITAEWRGEATEAERLVLKASSQYCRASAAAQSKAK
ncbi:hypothetical protein ABB37_07380 [Leptomonas pyrrhocoris]|uniref:AB hydrolase-1 domain-containing protein n=1 Tax=Leptomonas pyrrhocoris TaxID=157538 RepID=A0A0M9FW03_LEPPY|nr:hypothetical protein ABB37_07380 [Leptomonas pyrrhocoris]KPA77036.1 hypothetical protein ABB37_07380 [Leptomonas pyrrhocoris]|eukprot:XP_015655475.1 hypothetical protein ABB37_07380 [Leptomonas pyrrhocoris]